MSRIDKIIEKAQENPGNLKFIELVKLGNHFGYDKNGKKEATEYFTKVQVSRDSTLRRIMEKPKLLKFGTLLVFWKTWGGFERG